ncbi:PKD domain-containing protein [Pedobacter aquatilis]|uniref:PKD domain-containing protein n=1 Tax=Pedobacter aquatilis TaxID=351343 RepID=UPI002931A310|nr:PKD domain-containing protein [Pedobacter aquatilis]
MRKATLLVFVVLFFTLSNAVFGQTVSNEGTDFWAVFPTHVPNMTNNLASLAVFVTSKAATEVTVSCGAWSQKQVIPANTAIQFDVPRANAYVDIADANQNLTNRGIHIKVTDGKPKVSAYTHIYAGARSAASLILPYETLGQTYYSMNYTQSNGGNNFFTIVAVEDNTTVLLHEKSGSTKTITLAKAGDVYEYISGTSDLTGVYVETDAATSSCKRFAAFSGSSVLTIACTGSQDPLYQQLYPTVSWGKNYGVVAFTDRKYILRILAQEDNTTVTYNAQTFTINKGQYLESGQLTESAFITSDKLISVAQYSLTQACSAATGGSMIGDPDMVMLNPIEFNIKAVTVFSSTLQNISVRYINILMKADKTSTFKINGVAPAVTWATLLGNNLYAFAQIPVTESSLTLTADDGFNAIAYGFGQAESYAYSAGTNLASNNYLTVVNEAKNEESPNGCVGQVIDFKVSLPYQPDKITWTLENSTPEVTLNPVPETKTTNGQTVYIYKYPVNKTYTTTGEYHLNVVAHVPNNATSCQSGDLETNYVFTIYNLPTANFDLAASSCAKSDITFTDKSSSNSADFAITNWFWDFGDGSTSTEQNPKHQYANEGTYNVSLSVKAGTGCYSDAVIKTVKIFPLPVSKFAASLNTCINTDYRVTDQSSISSAKSPNTITKWSWDFGDGTKIDKTDATPFVHQYTSAGSYTVSLLTTSGEGCVSEVYSQKVTVADLPVADFSTPDICLTDAIALFTNKSTDVTGGSGTFTYAWDFGDAASTTANPNTSTDKDGKHKYANFGNYTVTLKITNINGCVSTITKQFTVNGAVQKAEFTVQNENNLCSNSAVVINNSSTTFFGRITKIDIYKDFIDHPEEVETIMYPTNADIPLTYAAFGGAGSRNYLIRMVAYSGESCFQEAQKTITLKPSPILTFEDIPAACQNDGSVVINQAKENSEIAGTGIYSGDGVDAEGNFNPKNVSTGEHVITYTFTATNGCAGSISKTIKVYKSPTADAGATLYILSGGQVTIPAVADGSGLTYKWTPSVGLDHDNVLNPVASPEKDTDYQLIATTDEGCTVTTSVTVKVLQALNPPNSFTPNGDGVNDVWNIKYLESYPNATIEVFNRNGVRVFFSNGYKVPFDGNYQNEALPVGVYYYLINPRNGRKAVTGPLTIIR